MEQLGPKLLHARTSACLTQGDALERAGLTIGASSLSEWENGGREPSVAQLARLASTYRRSIEWFLSDSPIEEQPIKWRQRPVAAGEIEARFRQLATYFHELEVLCGSKVPIALPEPTQVHGRRDAELLADHVRTVLQLGPRPGRLLRARLEEACGVKLFGLDFLPSGTAATLCDREGVGVAVLLNLRNSARRLNFDLAHELYHVVAVSSPDEERLADVFAAQLLMPADDFLREVDLRSENEKTSHEAFLEVVREFAVSVGAAVWRLHSLRGRPPTAEVETVVQSLRRAWSDDSGDETLFQHPPSLPERYVSLARRAFSRGLISTGHYAKCLGISRSRAMAEQTELESVDGVL